MGLLDQVGAKAEVTYGTAIAVDRFYEFTSEGLERRNRTIQSDGIRAGGRALRRGARRALVGRDGGGSLQLEVGPDLFGLWFEHALGSVASAQPDNVNAPTVWEHTFTMGSLRGKSLTVQKGVEQEDGTVIPFTFAGTKIADWRVTVGVDGFAVLDLTLDSQDVLTGEALQAATFVDGPLFHFAQASLELDDVVVAQVRQADIGGNNNLALDRYFLGNQGLKHEPRDDGYPEITGNLEAEFVDRTTFYDVMASDDPLKLELAFVGDVLEDTQQAELRLTVPEIRLGGGTPTVDGPTIPRVRIPFSGFYDGTSPSTTVLLRNTDATP